MLHYTGHPLVDVGVATATAFADKRHPEDLTESDLSKLTEYMIENYTSGKMTSYLSSVFTMNAVYTQPSFKTAAVRREKARELLDCSSLLSEDKLIGVRCFLSGEEATRYANRQHVPMLTGEGVLNFFPAGFAGLPISGKYLLAMQALPLGCRRCLGRLLAVHCPDDADLTYRFAKEFLMENRRVLLLDRIADEKYPDAKVPKTLIITTFLQIDDERDLSERDGVIPSISVYHLTNDGRDPGINLYHLPSQVVKFLRYARSTIVGKIWKEIELRSWQQPELQERKKKKAESSESAPPIPKDSLRNFLYEDLFSLPDKAASFIRTYFLRRAYKHAKPGDPRAQFRLKQELQLISWPLTSKFLEEILEMDKGRIDAIKILADRLTEHIVEDNDKRFFENFHRASKYGQLRLVLIKASNSRIKRGKPPIVEFEQFVEIFEQSDYPERIDWNLARDLILIRMIEQLHQKAWFGGKEELLDPAEQEELVSV